ncbi:basic proline-rich protein-like [Ovis canadensis]|uniref:basic proline-rich protein-like n=1 Tax=Ovis canadensis TaxID=37174 RepID=UPI0037528EF9
MAGGTFRDQRTGCASQSEQERGRGGDTASRLGSGRRQEQERGRGGDTASRLGSDRREEQGPSLPHLRGFSELSFPPPGGAPLAGQQEPAPPSARRTDAPPVAGPPSVGRRPRRPGPAPPPRRRSPRRGRAQTPAAREEPGSRDFGPTRRPPWTPKLQGRASPQAPEPSLASRPPVTPPQPRGPKTSRGPRSASHSLGMLRPLRVRSGSDAPSSGPARATRNLAGLRSSFPAPARPPPARAPRSPAGPPAPGVRPRAAHSPRAPSAARAPLGCRPGRAQGGRAHRPGRGRGRLPAAEFSWEWSRGSAGGRRRWTHALPARAGPARPAGGRRPRAALPPPAARSRVRPAGPRGARAPPRALRPASPRRRAAPRPPQPAPGASSPSACRAAPSLQARCRFNS